MHLEDRKKLVVDRYIGGDETAWDEFLELYSEKFECEGELGGAPFASDGDIVMNPNYLVPTIKMDSEDPDQKIREKAYQLWEEAGCPECDGLKFWYEAEKLFSNYEKFINSWVNKKTSTEVKIYQNINDGKYKFYKSKVGAVSRLNMNLGSLLLCGNIPIKAEEKAVEKLRKHLKNDQFRQYLMSGSFGEFSKRTGLFYVFRKGKPTIVIRKGNKHENGFKILCCLCLHVSSYYCNSWLGTMPPTDDVVAHLLMMRACEEKYWAKSNQYDPDSFLSGI